MPVKRDHNGDRYNEQIITTMTQKQFTKFATGLIGGLQTMEDLRNNKSSLFESYPVLAEGDNWDNLVIFAREHGLTPVCNHIRVARSKEQVLNLLANRGYTSIGEIKYLRTLINLYTKVNIVEWDFRLILKDWKEYIKTLTDNNYNEALRDYTYNNVLKAIAPLVFDNPKFKEIVMASIGAGILKTDNPVDFVRDWYTCTDLQGNLLVPVNYINGDNTIIATKWEYKQLTAKVAQSVFEVALSNVKRCFKAGKMGRKFTPLKRAEQGTLTGQYWSVTIDNKGRFAKGDKMEYNGVIEEFETTLADRNKEVKE